jgi:hypothetical protein
MRSQPAAPALTDRIRLAACLLHAVPGACGALEMSDGERTLVAHHRLDAVMTPCELRAGLLEPSMPGVPHLAGMIRSIEVVAGADDIGGGLYRRSHPSITHERWFVTTLGASSITTIATDCPDSIDHREVSVRVCSDIELGASAVCISAARPIGSRFDDVARWLHRRCLVEELVEPLITSPAA